MTCRMTLRMKLRMKIKMKPRMTFKTLDFEGVFKRALIGDFKVDMEWDMEGDLFNSLYFDTISGLVL